jgi:hypothetical protein
MERDCGAIRDLYYNWVLGSEIGKAAAWPCRPFSAIGESNDK